MESIYVIENDWKLQEKAPLHFLSGGVWRMEASYCVKRRNYGSYLLLYTMDGEGLLSYEEEEHRLLRGTVFLIDCNRYQMYRTAGEHWTFAYVHFTADALRPYVDALYQKHGAVFHPADAAAVESGIRAALECFHGYHAAAEQRAFGWLAEVLGLLYASAEMESGVRVGEYTREVFRVMEEHYTEKLTLDDIARRIRCSKFYLAHRFREEVGVSVYEYLTLFRLSKSKLLLQNTNLSVAEIAEQTGFSSVSNFIKTFAKYETLTPLQYRRQWM